MSKVMVSIPEELLAALDAEAERRTTSRSALLAAAARRELARPDPERVAAAIARSERRFDSAGTFESADLVRQDRDSTPVTRLLVDTSVLIKWFHSDGESELSQARALRSAHVAGELDAHMLDLAPYEVGNVLSRGLRWTGADVADQLDDLHAILGPPLVMTPLWLRRAASLAHTHTLSFYDASWAAVAVELGIPLVSADRRLLDADLAESPTHITTRLRLSVS